MTTFEQQRRIFALKRLGIQTADDLERYLLESEADPAARDRRRAEMQEAMPSLKPLDAPSA